MTKSGTNLDVMVIMKRILLSFAFLIIISAKAQNTISGSFFPANDYSWLIAYRLKPGTQVYAADTAIKNGDFTLKLPEDSPSGTYRLVYAVPQEEYFFDVIYNGKEDIKLKFDQEQGVDFIISDENILFGTYFKEINSIEQSLISYYAEGSSNKKVYQEILQKFHKVQKKYEDKSENLVSHQFIKANKPYIPTDHETVQDYVQNRKNSYFENLDLNNPILHSSGFLTDKLTNYAFTALPLETLKKEETEIEIQENVSVIAENLKGVSDTYLFHVFYTLWTQSIATGFEDTADHIFKTHLKPSPLAATNKDVIDKIEIYNRLRIGAVAPKMNWKEGETTKSLSSLEEAENYILIFWSSTCGHCLRELPALHKELKKYKNIKVVAVGLENSKDTWELESAKLDGFSHAIALGKWESDYAKLYDIHATPSYFILDSNKKIIAKPETDKEIVEFLKEND
ncbi:TlpA family protein disulfide reductase [Maribacter sp. 2308TA10-17]|uniref:TlpA family protein disulfide reductase n=1 Tax=Maribacter sp. 2308TA10-17 TaxID=3386276 RepID=UPI0039BC7E09